MELVPVVVLLLGPDGQVVDTNAAAEVDLGVPREQLRGCQFVDLVIPDQRSRAAEVSCRPLRQRRGLQLEVRRDRGDKGRQWVLTGRVAGTAEIYLEPWQDGTVVHCTHEWPTLIGADCVVGHNAHLEGCVVGDGCLIGSGSITLNRVTVGAGAIVAAACLVPEGFEVPPAALVAGVPAKIKRTGVPAGYTEESVRTYIESGRVHRAGLRRLDRP